MVRIAGLADLHIGARHLGKLLEHGRHSSLDDQQRALERVCDLVDERRVDVVLLAGDLTHAAHPDPESLALLGAFFRRLADQRVRVVAVAGNHDPLIPGIARHFRGDVEVALEPRLVRYEDLDVGCLPYLPDRYVRGGLAGSATREEVAHALTAAASEIVRGFLAQRRPGIPMVLAAHATVAGSTTSTGFSMGFIPGTDWILPVEDLGGFELVIAGHIHRHQSPAENVVVPGSLAPLDFAEQGEHGVIVADVAQGRTAWNFVPVPSRPIVTYAVDFDDPARDEEVLVNLLAGRPAYQDAPCVRVRLTCDADEARRYPARAIAAGLYAAGAHLAQVEVEIQETARGRDVAMRSSLGPLAALEHYLLQRPDAGSETTDRIARAAAALVGDVAEAKPAARIGGLTLRRLELQEFMSIAEADVTFADDGVTAVTGPSASGKSALICDAIRYALFGTSRYGGKGSDRLVRRTSTSRRMSVAVTFAGEDGRELRIVRQLAQRKSGSESTLDVLVRDGAREAVPA